MIVAMVKFQLPAPISIQQAHDAFEGSAPKYQSVEGLIRKYYLLSEDGKQAGGVYLWRSKKDAEPFYDDSWERFILSKYGSRPSVTYFESPVVVDNVTKEIIT